MAKQPKILAFAGNQREHSFTRHVVKTAMKGTLAANAEVNLVDLRSFPIPIYNGDDRGQNGFDENAFAFYRKIPARRSSTRSAICTAKLNSSPKRKVKMKRILIKTFLAIFLSTVGIAAQDALPVNTKTRAITDLKPLLSAAKENKKPLLVNFWATWCGPCRVEFPELVKIDAEYRRQGLDFAVVSVDNLGAMDSLVADFLKSYASTMESYLLDLPSRAKTFRNIRQIAPRAQNGFPLTLLYDANGKLVYQKNGVVNAKILRSKIDKVLPSKR